MKVRVESAREGGAEAIGQSLSHGAAGTALLHVERAWTGAGSWDTAHTHIRLATAAPVDVAPHTGLYYGAPAVRLLLHVAADRHVRYQVAAQTLDGHVDRLIRQRLAAAGARIDSGQPATFAEYDLFSGLAGLGILLRHCRPNSDLLNALLRHLVRLTEPRREGGVDLPGWWVNHDPDQILATPGGHANFGMAHGAAGLLALLALTVLDGQTVEGQHAAINTLVSWFDQWRQDGPDGVWWPSWITRDELSAGRTTARGPGRPSWCYGTPGVCRALQLAARATGDVSGQRAAEEALAASLTDVHLDRITEPGLCHGIAGIYQTAYRAAGDAHGSSIGRRLPKIADRLIAVSIPAARRDGFLVGGAGIALAQATLRCNATPHTGWDTCLLVA